MSEIELIIVGAGPIGIACGVEASRAGLSHLLIEKGCLTNSIHRFAANLVFFSTPNLLEIGDVPFITAGPKPARGEVLLYYRRVAEHFRLNLRLYEKVLEVERDGKGGFVVASDQGRYAARRVVLAIGFYDHPNRLGVPGEELPKVSHFYREPHPYFRQKVAVIGGQNSAAEAALDLWRNGAEVTLIHRHEQLGSSLKYWIRPDLENRLREGSIKALFNAEVARIEAKSITVKNSGGQLATLENDFVFAMTGYHPDFEFLEKMGIRLESEKMKPALDPDTMETNVPGMYIAGVATGGKETGQIFIENGREHAKKIVRDILGKV